MKTNRKNTLVAIWLVLVVLVFLWTLHDYNNQPDIELKFELFIRHALVMFALTFPSGWVLSFISSLVFSIFGFDVSGVYAVFLISLECAIAGFLQWFIFLPWCWRKWRNRKRSGR